MQASKSAFYSVFRAALALSCRALAIDETSAKPIRVCVSSFSITHCTLKIVMTEEQQQSQAEIASANADSKRQIRLPGSGRLQRFAACKRPPRIALPNSSARRCRQLLPHLPHATRGRFRFHHKQTLSQPGCKPSKCGSRCWRASIEST